MEKQAESAKGKTFFQHGHIQWIALLLFSVVTVCQIIDVVAPKSKLAQDALKVEHVVSGHPVVDKLVLSEIQKLIERLEK